MIDDTFFDNFMADDPAAARAPDGMADKPTYTRAEVDEIIQQTIKSTMEALQGQTDDTPDSQAEREKEENENGSNEESDSDTGETE